MDKRKTVTEYVPQKKTWHQLLKNDLGKEYKPVMDVTIKIFSYIKKTGLLSLQIFKKIIEKIFTKNFSTLLFAVMDFGLLPITFKRFSKETRLKSLICDFVSLSTIVIGKLLANILILFVLFSIMAFISYMFNMPLWGDKIFYLVIIALFCFYFRFTLFSSIKENTLFFEVLKIFYVALALVSIVCSAMASAIFPMLIWSMKVKANSLEKSNEINMFDFSVDFLKFMSNDLFANTMMIPLYLFILLRLFFNLFDSDTTKTDMIKAKKLWSTTLILCGVLFTVITTVVNSSTEIIEVIVYYVYNVNK